MNDVTPRPYAVDIPLRWGDMDAFGHVNNVQLVRVLEQARVEAFLDWVPGEGSTLRAGVVVARQEVEYLEPLEYRRDPVRVEVWISRLGRTGFDIAYQVRDPDGVGQRVYARAETSMVAWDLSAAQPRALTEQERHVYQSHHGDPVQFRRPSRQSGERRT